MITMWTLTTLIHYDRMTIMIPLTFPVLVARLYMLYTRMIHKYRRTQSPTSCVICLMLYGSPGRWPWPKAEVQRSPPDTATIHKHHHQHTAQYYIEKCIFYKLEDALQQNAYLYHWQHSVYMHRTRQW